MSISEKKYKDIIYTVDEGISSITLNRPNKLNALRYLTIMEILDAFELIKRDKTIRVIVINGAGRSFCSGDDFEIMGTKRTEFPPLDPNFKMPHHKLVYLIREIQKPVIALLHGYCLGAGLELALACDFRLSADNLEIGDHRTTRAICMLHGASWFLPRLIGFSRATEIILTGRHLDAKEAMEIGLVHRVYPARAFNQCSKEFIQEIAQMPTRCLGYNKAMLNYSIRNDLISSLQNEFLLFNTNMKSYDFREGNRSYLEKRKPQYKGR
ncbi:MAG: enoyl-CoA hydratase/isomerase family protein [Promethearchaeota archaeon]|jgi:2-(1,2-epoxy-1,2-dihydrophenyl)acetyl-CoA isomerase